MAGEDEFHDDNTPPPPPPVTPTQQAPHTLSTIKLPILKKGEYDIWAMKMEHYLGHTDYPIWEVIQKGNGPVQVSTDTNGQIKVLPPKTAEEILARERERKARTTLLMAIPEDHLAKFHKMTDAKEMWEAIKSRFGGNDESKKMQKYILKQQFESFSVSNSEGLHKGYDRFQSLLSQLEIHGAGVSTEDANQKFLRSLPASWSQVSLIMRTKPGVDTLSFDDLYNNLRVFESDIKGSTASSSSTQNVAFVSSESTNSTNDVSTAYGVSTSSGYNSQKEGSSSYTDELKYSFFANQSSGPQLDHEDLEQVDEFDLEEMDLKWQVAMISWLKKFYRRQGEGCSLMPRNQLALTRPSQPKVWSDALIIKEYESKSDDEYVIKPSKEQEKPSFAFVNTVKHAKNPRETVKEQNTCSPSPKVDKRDWNGSMSKRLGLRYGFTKKACFVCFSYLIRDCDFHEKRMAKQVELNKKKGKGTGQGENRLVWNNVQRLNHQNKNLSSQTAATSTARKDDPQKALKNKGIIDSGCSRHMAGNKAYLVEYQDYNSGLVCDKKNKILFTNTECLVLSPDFKLLDENQVLLRVPRQNNMYSFNLENIIPTGGLACLIAKATVDESNKWHRRLGHVNFKNLNKLMKRNLVRGLPSKIFQNDHTCVACQKGKQHKASCKAKVVSSISQPLQLLHMDLFGPTSVRSINHKTYFLIITDDFSRCDNGIEFKNMDIIEFCGSKGTKREYSNARTPQQNRVAKRKNRTLIESARTMLADSFLPNTFWAKAVSATCYVLNRVLVTKPQNKTPYELITSKIPIISYIRPFGCHVTILNTIDHLGKFEEKSDEGFLVGYSLNNKAFRVYILETKRVEENLHINFLENKPNAAGKGPNWLFDLDYLTDSMNYQPVTAENKANKTAGLKEANLSAGTQENIDAGNSEMETEPAQEYFVLPVWSSYTSTIKSSEAKNRDEKPNGDTDPKTNKEPKDQED
ncbi:putative ribonuclease H-like domain-containing protein [Tanacetum coccineum]